MTDTKQQPTGRLMLRNVRLSFPQVFKAVKIGDDGEPRFSANFLLDPSDPQVDVIRKTMQRVAKEKWADKAQPTYVALEKGDKLALHDGDTKANYDGYSGMLFLSAASPKGSRPTVVDRNKNPVTEEDGVIYSGCYVNASVDIWAQDNGFGKRINAQLRGIQFSKDGDAFSGGRPADVDEFDDLGEGADSDEFGGDGEFA